MSESFGSQLHVWQISPGVLKESIDLGSFDGCLTTTVRSVLQIYPFLPIDCCQSSDPFSFLHNPECNHAFACSAVGSSVFHLHMNSVDGKWSADKVFQVEPIQVWAYFVISSNKSSTMASISGGKLALIRDASSAHWPGHIHERQVCLRGRLATWVRLATGYLGSIPNFCHE